MSIPTYAELLERSDGSPPGSSWGLWGDQDQLGTLNLLTEERARAASTAIRTGKSHPLNLSMSHFSPPLFGRRPVRQEVVVAMGGSVRDETLHDLNTQASSQWDGFGHVRSREFGFYNGLPPEELDISTWAETSIVGRGVLLDCEPFITDQAQSDGPPASVTPADLEEIAATQGTTIEEGDILLLHFGWLEHRDRQRRSGFEGRFTSPGLHPSRSMVARLWDWHVAAVAADNPAVEVWPPGAFGSDDQRSEFRSGHADDPAMFIHPYLLALLGVPLGELWDTRALAEACRRDRRYEFMLVSAPMGVPGGLASPSNAVALR